MQLYKAPGHNNTHLSAVKENREAYGLVYEFLRPADDLFSLDFEAYQTGSQSVWQRARGDRSNIHSVDVVPACELLALSSWPVLP